MLYLKSVLLIITILSYILFLTKRLSFKISIAPLLTFSFFITVLYLFAYVGILPYGVIVITLLGLNLGIYSIYKSILVKDIIFDQELLKFTLLALLYMVPLIVLYRLIPKNFIFFGWDELSHWALSTKDILSRNGLYVLDSPMIFKHYPPGITLFHYYFAKMFGPTDFNILFSQILFTISALIALFGSSPRPFIGLAGYALSFLLIKYFGFSFYTINVDMLLAIIFAACLILAYKSDSEKKNTTSLFFLLITLTLIKQIGFVLSLIVFAVYTLIQLIEFFQKADKAKNDFSIYLSLIRLPVVFLGFISAYFSWTRYAKYITWQIPMPKITSFFQDPLLHKMGAIAMAFVPRVQAKQFFTFSYHQSSWGISLISLTFFLITLSFLILIFYDKKLKTFTFLNIIIIGALSYILFLLFCYLVFFEDFESLILSNFERYAGTYYLSWSFVLVVLLFELLCKLKLKFIGFFISLLPVFLLIYFAPFSVKKNMISPLQMDQRSLVSRQEEIRLIEILNKNLKKGDKVFFVRQNHLGFDYYLFKYLVNPIRVQPFCWSIGKKYYDGDIWTCDAKLENLVQGYKYLVIKLADKQFWDDNGYLFAQEDIGIEQGVFKISYSGNKIVFNNLTNS